MPRTKALVANRLPVPTETAASALRQGATKNPAAPIFLHASWRTSSTWFFLKFRRLDSTLCFYEPFNHEIGELTRENIAQKGFSSWSSGHPPSEPYFLEFLPLLRRGGGVRLFGRELADEWFIPEGGLGGRLRPQEVRYLSLLVRHAAHCEKTPVFGFTRSLGRIGALKRQFPGRHIFLYRNLWSQWASYLNQRRNGNEYFIATILNILLGAGDPFFASVINDYLLRTIEEGQRRPLSPAGLAGMLAATLGEAELFGLFMAMHVYLYGFAQTTADLSIDVTRLARDGKYRAASRRQVSELTALPIDFGDIEDVLQAHSATPTGIDWGKVRETADNGVRALAHLCDAGELVRFGTVLIEETIAEMRTGERYVRRARSHIARLTTERDDLAAERQGFRETCDRLARERDAAAGVGAELAAERDRLAGERNAALAETVRLAGERDAAAARRNALAAELDQAVRERDDLVLLRFQLLRERDGLRSVRDDLARQHDDLACRHDALFHRYEQLARQYDAACAEHAHQRDADLAETNRLRRERNATAAELLREVRLREVMERDRERRIGFRLRRLIGIWRTRLLPRRRRPAAS